VRGPQRILYGAIALVIPSIATANVVGSEDGRRPITAAGAELGLSAAEIVRIRSTTGYVFCPGSEKGNQSIGSGALLMSTQVAVATAHQFVDEQGQLRAPLAECTFRNQAVDPQKSVLAEPVERSLYLGMIEAPPPAYPRDFAVAHLKSPVRGAEPFPLYEGTPDELIGHEAILVTAYARNLQSDPQIPLVQACMVKTYMSAHYWNDLPAAQAMDVAVLLTDCDAEKIASGGILLGRFNGALLAIGTVLSTGNTDKDGRPFNYADDSYTAVLLLSGQYLDAVNGMAGKGEMPADNALTTASE